MSRIQPANSCPGLLPASSNRRTFLRHFVLGTAVSTLAGREWMASLVADLVPSNPSAGILRVKVADFPALANENGSVRLALNPFTSNGPNGTFYPVIVNRGAGNTFFTLQSRCTHEGCVVPVYNPGVGASICPCHGSRFRLNGTVLQGPAGSPLTSYVNSFDSGEGLLCIQIPNLGFSVTSTTVDPDPPGRVKLEFPAFRGTKYEVRFAESISDAGVVVPFATTATGPATLMEINGVGQPLSVYLDRTTVRGFYSVAIKVSSG